MYILDTDHLSLIQRNGEAGQSIVSRLTEVSANEVAVTIITYEEQVRGRLSVISRAKTMENRVAGYFWLQTLMDNYRSIRVLPFDRAAAEEYGQLRKAYPRLGSMDLKIAAIAIIREAVLLTRNGVDFGQIVELDSEDWSVGESL